MSFCWTSCVVVLIFVRSTEKKEAQYFMLAIFVVVKAQVNFFFGCGQQNSHAPHAVLHVVLLLFLAAELLSPYSFIVPARFLLHDIRG
jgi:hypothetical protein